MTTLHVSLMKKSIHIILSVVVVLLLAWRFYASLIWSQAWEHYEAGGGVFVKSQLNEKEMTQALEDFRRHYKISPLSTKSRNYAGKALIRLGRYKEAIKEFDRSLSIRSTFTAHYRKAFALMKLERFYEMEESLEAAYKHHKDFDSHVRFTEEFGHMKDHPSMSKFRKQFKG